MDREGSNGFLVSGKAPWQLLFGQFHNLGSFVTTAYSSQKEGTPASALHLELRATLKGRGRKY
jgi:hypothetical protein